MRRKAAKSVTAAALSILFLLSSLPLCVGAANDNYDFVLTYADFQCNKYSHLQTYPANGKNNNNPITWQTLSNWINNRCAGHEDTIHHVKGNAVYLAKNELEAFQIYFYEQSAAGRSLRVEVAPFVKADGQVLPHTLYREDYFTAWVDNHYIDPVADALLPYHGETIETQCGTNDVIYVQLHADKDQSAGNYVSEVRLYDGEELLRRETVTAVVWDFALPESHYSSVVCGMYDTASSYTNTHGFLELNGVRFDAEGEVLPQDRAKAEKILEGWTNYLADYGVTTQELPRWLIDDDPKAAELAMADPRRKVFFVPLENSDILDLGNRIGYDEQTEAKILQYKDLAYNNPYLRDKAVFFIANEPHWATSAQAYAEFTTRSNAIESLWPGHHGVAPYKGDEDVSVYLNTLRKDQDDLCLAQAIYDSNAALNSAYHSGDWFRTWRYPSGNYCGSSFELYNHNKSVVGLYRRVFFWQQNYIGGNGMYYWNCAYTPRDENGAPYNMWSEMTLPLGDSISTGNGNGILAYPGVPKELDAATPVPSLRLMQINDGLDDYDYLQLLKEFYDEGSDERQNDYFLSSKNPMYYGAWECDTPHYDRIRLGNALEKAQFSHDFREWHVAVEADETHEGMLIRTCADCGTQESRRFPLHTHDYSDWTEKAATCTDPAKLERVCSVCGDTLIREVEASSPLSHSWTFTEDWIAPTCTSEGKGRFTCSVCGKRTIQPTPVDPDAHGWELTETITEPNCTEDGEAVFTCSYCGKTYTQWIEPDPNKHVWETFDEPAPTCTTGGCLVYNCMLCGLSFTDDDIPPLGHNWTLTGYITEPNCTDEGEGVFTCSRCGRTKTEWIPPDPDAHDWGGFETEATCTQGGYTEYICMFCGAYRVGDETPPLGHDFGEWVITTVPTHKHEGTKTRSCRSCGFLESQTLDQLICKRGDVDGDETLDLKDVVKLARFLAGGWNVTIDTAAADVNKDGQVNLKDSVILQRYLAGGWNIVL